MSFQERLQAVFPESYQARRVAKEVDLIKDAKGRMGLQLRYISRRKAQFVIIVEILQSKLKQIKKLSFLSKLQFKIVMPNTYPAQPPRVYFLNQNSVEIGLNPFHNYLRHIMPDWGTKHSALDIIKLIPVFVVQNYEKSKECIGEKAVGEYFQAERLFIFQGCQIFPVKLFCENVSYNAMMGIINGEEIILLEQTTFSNSYISTDFIPLKDVFSIQKHKTKHLRVLIEIKRDGKKYALQFSTDEYDIIIEILIEKMKTFAIAKEGKESSDSQQDSDDEQEAIIPAQPSQQFAVTQANIGHIQSQILILQSIIQANPSSSKIRELVQLLKKAVQFYSIKGSSKCQVYLKSLQTIMNNQITQTLLLSQDGGNIKDKKIEYQSIANYI